MRMHDSPKILVAEDEPEVRGYLEAALRSSGFSVDLVEDGEEALACLVERGAEYSLLLMDLIMPRKDGMETLRHIRQFDTGLPIIMFSSAASPLNVVDAIKNGANDFLAKPVGHDLLNRSVQKALRIPAQVAASSAEESSSRAEEACIASSSWTRKLDLFLKQVGSSEVPVLLQGETGVGKEVLARQIHACSPRARKAFLKLNCAALPSELIESELFGYERGAFTGAFRSSPGKFEMADGGTILLDEIGDMDFKLQAKLLQVLQDGEFLRLGGKEMCRVNVRVIAATHCDLEQAIVERRFREDLYYRLNVIRIEVPPLRERREEILPLVKFFLKKHSRPGDAPIEITAPLKQALLIHSWPGNIRELENVVRKLVVLRRPDEAAEELKRDARRQLLASRALSSNDQRVAAEPRKDIHSTADIPGHTLSIEDPGDLAEISGQTSVLLKVEEARKQAETEAIIAALNTTLWNRKEAAALLNIEYKALLYKIKKLGIGERIARAAAT